MKYTKNYLTIITILIIACGCIRIDISWNENIDGSEGPINDGNRIGIYVEEIRYNEDAKVTYTIKNNRLNAIYIPKEPYFEISGLKESYGNTTKQLLDDVNKFYIIDQFEEKKVVVDIKSIFKNVKRPFTLESFEIQGYYQEYVNDDKDNGVSKIKPFYIYFNVKKIDSILIKENAQQGVAPEPVMHQ